MQIRAWPISSASLSASSAASFKPKKTLFCLVSFSAGFWCVSYGLAASFVFFAGVVGQAFFAFPTASLPICSVQSLNCDTNIKAYRAFFFLEKVSHLSTASSCCYIVAKLVLFRLSVPVVSNLDHCFLTSILVIIL